MEIPWLSRLTGVDLIGTADGGAMIYLAHDRVTGKIFKLSPEIAASLDHAHSVASGAVRPDRDRLKDAFAFFGSLKELGRSDFSRPVTYNPIFFNIPLFDVGARQHRVRWLTRLAAGRAYVAVMCLLVTVAFFLGSWSDWQILEVFASLFSLSALATFAVVAPVLKLVHELGHVVVADRFGVRVRMAGLYLIGLYPMPYVDCSEADLSASRAARIHISLAGLYTDLLVALVAFVSWHLVDGGFLKTLMGNIFLFSSLNSVLFNANPLIKLDGYYALADAIGRRNLYADAAIRARGLGRYITTFGAEGRVPRERADKAMTGYAIASVLYKVNMILGIMWLLMPRFSGLGVLLVIWGGYMMFFSPLLRATTPGQTDKRSSLPFWLIALGLLGAGMVFVKLPFVVVAPMVPDFAGRYEVRTETPGYLVELAAPGWTDAGGVLARLENPDLAREEAITDRRLILARSAFEAIRSSDPAQAIVAEEQVRSLNSARDIAVMRQQALILLAPDAGRFVANTSLRPGAYLAEGTAIGAFYPAADGLWLTGAFPERFVEKFRRAQPVAEVRTGQRHLAPDSIGRPELVERIVEDSETGQRSYDLSLRIDGAPSDLATAGFHYRLRLPPEPLYRHVQFMARQLVQKFRDARVSRVAAG